MKDRYRARVVVILSSMTVLPTIRSRSRVNFLGWSFFGSFELKSREPLRELLTTKDASTMGICIKSKPTAAALLALCGLGATPLFADGKFIVQPSLRKPAPSAVQPETQGESGSAGETQPGLTVAAALSFESLAAPIVTARIDSASSGATPFSVAAPPSSPLQLSGPASPAPQAVIGDARQSLQWVARSARSQPPVEPQSALPIQTTGPSVSPATSSSTTSSPTTSSPTVPFPTVPESRTSEVRSAPFTLASTRATTHDVASPVQASQESSRAVLASLISDQIISGRPAADAVGRSVNSIDSPPGWQAIGEELSQRLGKCEALINRKAYFSAREDAEAAMLYLVRVLDLMSNHYHSEPAWHAASKAMSEAEDFSNTQRLTSDSDFLRRVILSHETPVLKDADATTLAPLAAAQHYRQYAEDKLVEAAQGHPWASEVLYALGRSYQSHSDASQDGLQQNMRWRAVTLYRGARAVSPANAPAANQLGFVLLQMDRPVDAREALVAALNAAPSRAAYENLVEVSRRLGDANTGNWARQQALAFRSTPSAAANAPEFVEVDPRVFAAMSPYSVGPNPQAHDAQAPSYRTAVSGPTNH